MLGYSDRSPRFIIEGDVMEFAELLVSMQDALDRTDLDVPPPPSPLRNLETFSSLDGTLVIDGSNEIYKKGTTCSPSGKDDYSWGSLESSITTIRQELNSNIIFSSSDFTSDKMQASFSALSAAPAAPSPLSGSCVPPSTTLQPPLFRSLSGSRHYHFESTDSKHALPTAICLGNSIYKPGEHALTVISLQTTRSSSATAEMNIDDGSPGATLLNSSDGQAPQAPYGLAHTGFFRTGQDDKLSKPTTAAESTANTTESQELSPFRPGMPDRDVQRPSTSQSSTPRVLPCTPCGVPPSPAAPSSSTRDHQLSSPFSSRPLEAVSKTMTSSSTSSAIASPAPTPRVIPHAPRLLSCPQIAPRRHIQTAKSVSPLLNRSGAILCCTDEIREIKTGAKHIAVYTASAERKNAPSPLSSCLDPLGSPAVRMTNTEFRADTEFRGEYQGGGWV